MFKSIAGGLLLAGVVSVAAQAQFKAVQFEGLEPGPLGTSLVEGLQIRALDADASIDVIHADPSTGLAGNVGLEGLPRQALRLPAGGIEIRFGDPVFRISLDVMGLTRLEGAYVSMFSGDTPVGTLHLSDLGDPENAAYDPYLRLGEDVVNRISYTMPADTGATVPWFDRVVVVLPEGASLGGLQVTGIGGTGGGGMGFELTHISDTGPGSQNIGPAPLPPLNRPTFGGSGGGGGSSGSSGSAVAPQTYGSNGFYYPPGSNSDFGEFPDFEWPTGGGSGNPSGGSDNNVPEPATFVTLSLLGGVLGLRRRRA